MEPIPQEGEYIVLTGPDGDSSVVVHRPTGRTISQFTEDQHQAQAQRAARALNIRERTGA